MQKWINFDDITKENTKEHNLIQPQILNLINQQSHIDKIYLYTKDPFGSKYHLLVNKRESTCLKHFNDSKAFMEYSNNMNDIYKKS